MKIELKNIQKHFGPVRANDDISLVIEGGTIHGLLGENGAGKSTLMKVLSGFISADSGTILLNNNSATLNSPANAIAQGVGMLHQDPLDFPPMRLLENFLVGCEGIWLGRNSAETDFNTLCQQFDFDLDPHAYVHEITVGERQQLEIIRLLWRGVQALILDEPTTGISAPQKIKLFATLKQLAADGKTIIFVSHKLEDVEELCSQASILRQGKLVGTMEAPFDTQQIVHTMFGQIFVPSQRPNVPLGKPLLTLKDVTISDDRLTMSNLNLTIPSGEVIGLAGLEGSGQRLLMQACAGLLRTQGGSITIDEQLLTNQPYPRFTQAGVAFMPADRMEEGLVPGLTITEHTILAQQLQNWGNRGKKKVGRWIRWGDFSAETQSAIKTFNIKGTPDSTVESLSGGNQQRTLLALLPDTLRLLIMEHPTRGLDVESASYIWDKLLARRTQGTSIIFASADLDEIFRYSDRILVCFNGQITATLQTNETTINELGYLIGGKTI